MNIAFLFNSAHPSFGSWYSVLERILKTNELQSGGRHLRVSIGDISSYGRASRIKNAFDLLDFYQSIYQPTKYDQLVRARLEATYGVATVFCLLFQNMTVAIADALVLKLSADLAFLGAMDVVFATQLHLHLFRNSLREEFRLQGQRCYMFYGMGDNADPDVAVREMFEQYGFQVDYEDIGARRTVFDKYNTAQHFRRAEDFLRIFAGFAGLDDDQASALSLHLEELHPKLFDALASAARALERAETVEDLAQAALSGRRLLEQLSNYLFPPQDDLWNGRKVGLTDYRNRLWAYIERTLEDVRGSDPETLERLGAEIDRLVRLFNSGLHSEPTRQKLEAAFRDLVKWLAEVIELSPVAARFPYLAYEAELLVVVESMARDFLSE